MHRNDFVEIMEMLDKRLNDKGKNWRHVFKVRVPSDRAQHLPMLLCPCLVSHCSREGSRSECSPEGEGHYKPPHG